MFSKPRSPGSNVQTTSPDRRLEQLGQAVRVTFILPTVNMSGGTRVVSIYARELMLLGHTVQVVSPPPATTPLRRKLKSWLSLKGWPSDPKCLKSHLDDTPIDHRVLDRWRPVTDKDVPDGDVVIATWWETAEWVLRLSPRKGAKVYFIQHHEVFSNLPLDRCLATYRSPMHKIVIAQWLKELMETEYGDPVVDLVHNSVDTGQFSASPRGKQPTPTVGLLYATDVFKGLDVSLEVLKKLRESFANLRVVSFGSEPVREDLALGSGAEFFYSPPQHELRNFYAACDLWLTASRSEGFNLPAMEAMACRTPVVSTRAGWPAEAIKSGWNGVLADVGDIAALAEGSGWILTREDKDWIALSDNAFSTATAGSWRRSGELFESALQHACRRAARGEILGRPSRALIADWDG
jgi:glycosyltransferase involved in cell wall biosynthesis